MISPTPIDAEGSEAQRPPYAIYGGILVAIVVARWLQIFSQQLGWSETLSKGPTFLPFVAFAIVVSVFASVWFGQRLSVLMTFLLCGLSGAISTVVVDPLIGALIGFGVGGIRVAGEKLAGTSDKRENTARNMLTGLGYLALPIRPLLTLLAPSVLVAWLAGQMSVMLWLRWGPRDSRLWTHIALLATPVVVGAVLLVFGQLRFRTRKWRWIVLPIAVLLFLLAVPWFILKGMDRQTRWLRQSFSTVTVQSMPISQFFLYAVDPFINQQRREAWDRVDAWLEYFGMEPGLGLTTYVYLDHQSSPEEIDRAATIPIIVQLDIGKRCPITDAQFRSLNTIRLAMLSCYEGTTLTDKAFENVDFSRVSNLDLRGPRFGDEVLERLGVIPWLAGISLEGTRVTVEGLKKIDTTGPLYNLQLANTQVDDDVFAMLNAHKRLHTVNLSGTPVTGSGLKDFRSDIVYLLLDESRFESRYLADMLPPPGKAATPWNSLATRNLSIANTEFGEDLIENVKNLKGLVDYVDITGSDLTLEQIQQLGMSGYGLDATLLTPMNVLDLGRSQLIYHYDAGILNADQIVFHFETIEAARKAANLLPNGSYAQLVVHNFELSRSSLATLKQLMSSHSMSLELRNALAPDGRTIDYAHPYEVDRDYPELAP